jgi:hypothetical protein
VSAQTYKRKWASASSPVLVECDDGNSYVVKGRQAGRMIFNDQVLGALANLIGAPVPKPALVEVTAELIAAEPEMAHVAPGVAHGCRWIEGASDREGLAHTDRAENIQRFAYLAAFYGLAHASDHQYIYENAEPRKVHSVDHGHFFPSGPDWTEASLGTAPAADLDAGVASSFTWNDGHLGPVRDGLARLSDEVIAAAVSRPPDDWAVTDTERAALAAYLAARRVAIIKRLDERILSA